MALDVVNEAIGAGVMPTSRLVSLQLRLDDLGKLFTKLNTVWRHRIYESWEVQRDYINCFYLRQHCLPVATCLPPLIIGIDVPNHTLSEDLVLI